MGLLDDAIREHLELKRRHGADPGEVSRQEREALGAPVRGEFAQPAAAAAPAEEQEPVSEIDEEMSAEEPGADEPGAVAAGEVDTPEEPGAVAAGEVDAPEERAEPEPGTEEDPWLVDDLADEPPPPQPPPPDGPPASTDVVAPDEEPPAEDVLEETPEFLQETPEHERLWFEQKPPRDFDWDK